MSNSTKLDNATLSLFQNTDASIGISAIYIIITVINLAGNGLSMCLLLFCTSPKTPSIIFMINLTFTDLAVGAALPFQIMYLLQGYNWTLGSSMCRILTVVFFTNMYCSILTMTAISIDRYLGIVRPMLYRQMKEMKCIYPILVCLCMWVVVLAVLYPLMTTDHTYHFPDLGITTCFDMLKKDMLPSKTAWATFIFTLVFVLFLLPFFITTFCYIRVIRKLSRDAKTDQKDRAIRLMVIVLLVFTLCFAPNNILLIAHTVRRLFYGDSLYMAYKLSLTFSCANSCLDPIIYYLASKEFRQKLRKMLRLRLNSTSETTGRLEHRESLFSTHTEGHEADHAKMSGKTHASSL